MPIFNSNKVMFYPKKGDDGKSAYEVAVENGFVGTEKQWLASLVGGQPIYAATTADMTDTNKLYVTPDKKVYAYFAKKVPVTVNSFDPAAENVHLNSRIAYITAKGTVYDEGVYNASTNPNGIQVSWTGSFITDYIPADLSTFNGNLKVKISGYSESDGVLAWGTYGGGSAMVYFDEDKNHIADNMNYTGGAWGYSDVTAEDNAVTFNLNTVKSYSYNSKTTKDALIAATKYIRFAFTPNGSRTSIAQSDINNIKVEFEANTTQQSVFGWYDTGMTWTPTEYEDDILKINNELENHDLRITDLENSQGGTSELAVPSYWETAVAEAETKIKALQDNGGSDIIQFIWASDTHNLKGQTAAGRWSTPKNVGRLARRLMDDMNIPYAVITGDLVADIGTTDEAPNTDNLTDFFDNVVNPINKDNILTMTGNHDGATYTSEGLTISLSYDEKFNWFFRPFAKSAFEWGDYPAYYYKDLPQSKTRFIVLSPNDYSYTIDENRHPTPNPFRTAKYEASQLKWLAEKALDVPSGYSVVIFTHQPPVAFSISSDGFYTVLPTNNDALVNIVTAFANKTAYSGTVDGTQIAKDYTGITATMTAMFCGHIHYDKTDTSLAFPVVTIECAGNYSMNSATTFTNSTNNETAFDVVTINKAEGKIYLTRLGVGADRTINY